MIMLLLNLAKKINIIDLEVREYFHKGASPTKLKCSTGFNYYSERIAWINNGLLKGEYPRYTFMED